MIEGGDDLRNDGVGQEPTDEYGLRFDPFTGDHYLGNFPAHLEGLNVYNPQAGYRYYYCVNPEQDGGSSFLRLRMKYGAELVANEDPEKIGIGRLAAEANIHTGPSRAFGDVVLVRMPQDRYDQVRRIEQEQYRDSLDGVVHKYTEGDPHYMGKATRYVREDHGTLIEDL